MNIEVRYMSKSGNTKKLAEAIGEELGITAKPITQAISADTDILYLGGAVYWGGVDGDIKKFISTLGDKVKIVVVFSTAAIIPSAYPQMSKLIKAQRVTVLEKEFHCRGEFLKLHGGHPNAEDLKHIRQFARETIAGCR